MGRRSSTQQDQQAVMPLAVVARGGAEDAARDLALRLDLPLLPETDPAHCAAARALLLVARTQLSLQLTGRNAPGPVAVDFGAAAMRHRRRAGHNELLGKAVGVSKRPDLTVVDATAGLGRDAFVLADLGCHLTLCERHPVIAELLEWGLRAARQSEDSWLAAVAARMQLSRGDARQQDPASVQADVIHLDPMFPTRDKSAAVKKEMALFQLLLEDGATDDSAELLDWAMACDVARVVVKRPPRAPVLGGKPSHQISGKAVRYDVYVRRGFG